MFKKLRPIAPVLLLTLAACGGAHEESSAPTEAPAAASPVPESAPISPMSSRDAAPSGAATSEESNIDFTLPAGWQSEPASGMRLAQAAIPGSGGTGQLAVFYFGPGGGGDVDSNIQRWVGQMEPEQGATAVDRQTFETKNGLRVTWVDVPGTLLPSTMGTGPTTAQPNFRLLGAVVEGPGGPWFFKATGPKDILAAERENFLEMLRSVQPKQSA